MTQVAGNSRGEVGGAAAKVADTRGVAGSGSVVPAAGDSGPTSEAGISPKDRLHASLARLAARRSETARLRVQLAAGLEADRRCAARDVARALGESREG